MDFIKRHKVEIILFIVIAIIYFASRFFNILSLPIFTDEAIYIRWSQIAKQDAYWRFISLTDGKQPSFIWLAMILLRFIKDPLLAGRMVSVLAGFTTLIGLLFLGKELFKNKWIGIMSSFLYVLFPMALVYDRMALYDSLVGAFMVWSLFLSVLLVRRVRLDIALILGMVIGGGVLTKSNAFFSMPLLICTFLLFDWKQKDWKDKLLKLSFFSLIAIIFGFGFYSILRLSPYFHIISDKNALFAYPISEWIQHPTQYFISNLRGLFDWLLTYLTLPLVFLTIASFFITKTFDKKQFVTGVKIFTPLFIILIVANILSFFRIADIEVSLFHPYIFFAFFLGALYMSRIKNEYFREKITLFVWFAVPFIYLAFFGRTIYPRFVFFMALFLLPLAAFSLWTIYYRIVNKLLFWPLFLLLVVFSLHSDYFILTNFTKAPIPYSDLAQYNNDWPSGVGVREAVDFFQQQAKKGKITVGTQGTFGLMPFSLEIYLVKNPNIKILGLWPIEKKIPEELIEKAKIMPTYVVFYQPCDSCERIGLAPKSWPLTLIYKYEKPFPNRFFSIYQVNPR